MLFHFLAMEPRALCMLGKLYHRLTDFFPKFPAECLASLRFFSPPLPLSLWGECPLATGFTFWKQASTKLYREFKLLAWKGCIR
jgi:hypothetical protein